MLTDAEIGQALANLGHYRVVRVQELAAQGKPDGISGALVLCLGLRESGLQNINGGGTVVNGQWVPAKTDRGCFQISQEYHADFLKSVPGCPEGSWWPKDGHTALDEGFCPQFSPAVTYVLHTLQQNMEYGHDHGVADADLVRFAVAAYNAGIGGAIAGYRAGNVDKYTTRGDYSAWVLACKPGVYRWLEAHPNWRP